MFFLLPPKEVKDPLVRQFAHSLSQYNEFNYQTVPLYNLRNTNRSEPTPMIIETQADFVTATKTVSNTQQRKTTHAATKSRPKLPSELPKCSFCKWIFPAAFVPEDINFHEVKCRQGNGDQDKVLWEKCKGDKAEYKKKCLEMQRKLDKEAKTGKNLNNNNNNNKKSSRIEIESSDDELENIKIKKKKETAESGMGLGGVSMKKRKAGEGEQDQLAREDLKKVKKTQGGPSPGISGVQGGVRKTTQKKINLPMASKMVFDPSAAFSQFDEDN